MDAAPNLVSMTTNGLFPYTSEGGRIHLTDAATKRFKGTFLAAKPRIFDAPIPKKNKPYPRDESVIEAYRLVVLPNGWVRALIAGERDNHADERDLLLPPESVLLIETGWKYDQGPAGRNRWGAVEREARDALYKGFWRSLDGNPAESDITPDSREGS